MVNKINLYYIIIVIIIRPIRSIIIMDAMVQEVKYLSIVFYYFH
jgi:hypothetical protein